MQLVLALPEFAGDTVSLILTFNVLFKLQDVLITSLKYLAEEDEERLDRAQVHTIRAMTPLSTLFSDFQTHLCAVNPGAQFDLRAETLQALSVIFSHFPQSQAQTMTTGKNRHFSISRQQKESA